MNLNIKPRQKKRKRRRRKKKKKKAIPKDDKEWFEYEIEGAPWWMPVDQSIQYKSTKNLGDNNQNTSVAVSKSQTVVDPTGDDVQYMDNVRIIVPDNPWLEQNAEKEEDKRQYVLSIDFQVNCRKFILFTSLLLFLVVMTLISSSLTGFYEWRGYVFTFAVILILGYGIFVGFVCTEMNRYTVRTVLILLNIYWTVAWIVIVGLFFTAIVYLVLFPNKLRNYCADRDICTATLGVVIFAEFSLFFTLLLYILMMFFYMQRIANLVIIISNIRDYQLKYENNKFMRRCHKHMYRYLKGWKAFRTILSNHTGLRLSDMLYCSCCFRKCARDSSSKWRPFSTTNKTKRESTDSWYEEEEEEEEHGEKSRGKKKKKKKQRDSYNDWDVDFYHYDTGPYTHHQHSDCSWHCCDNVK